MIVVELVREALWARRALLRAVYDLLDGLANAEPWDEPNEKRPRDSVGGVSVGTEG